MNQKSFTLIEILVVIVIVGILSGFVLVISSSATDSANDAKRKHDIESLQKVILSYKTLYGLAPQEADECEVGNDCTNLQDSLISANYFSSEEAMPKDPDETYYTYESDDGTDFTLKGNLSNSYVYRYEYSTGFSEALPPEERVTNGGFETGNTSGWTADSYIYEFIVGTESPSPHGGIYRLFFRGDGEVYQNIDFTNVDKISFWYQYELGEASPAFYYKIGSNPIVLIANYCVSSWTKLEIDVSMYSGVQRFSFLGGEGESLVWLDDIGAMTN
jgi:prepilin-type N-terminal cleavage/methylation domain-containing protein